jgi:NAD(P)-dependent dehydrogenase (short-subunit alcohol dehydrogenase family)
VNNAGSSRPQDVSALLDLREDQWDAATNLNLKWTFLACQAAARSMSQGPAPDGGTITLSSQRLAA